MKKTSLFKYLFIVLNSKLSYINKTVLDGIEVYSKYSLSLVILVSPFALNKASKAEIRDGGCYNKIQ